MIWPDIYISEVYVLRTKCKTIAKNLPTTLRNYSMVLQVAAYSHVKSRFFNVS